MKKKLLSGLFFALLLVSCSSDDETTTTNSNDIMGKWYFLNDIVNGSSNPYDDHESCGKDYIEFKEGNILKSVDVYQCEEDITNMTYSIDGNSITFTNGSITRVATYNISNNILSITSQYDYNNDGSQDQVIQTFER